MFYPVRTAGVTVIVKTSLELFSLRRIQVWTYSVLGDCICQMKRESQDSRGSKPEIIFAVLGTLVNPASTMNRTQ